MGALVLALNPSIDAEWRVARPRWEEKNTIESERRWAGGKGVNVTRWLAHLGGSPRLLLPLGGTTGRELAAALRRESLPATRVALRDPTRVNVIVTTAEGRQLRFNPRGPKLSVPEWRSIVGETRRLLKKASCLVLSGSLPRGVKSAAYCELIRLAGKAGIPAVLDCDGPALAAAVAARPFLVKPNLPELQEWHGRLLTTRAAQIRAALALSRQTRGWVLVSLGGRGALLVNRELGVQLEARAPAGRAVNTVGAGDALLAAVVREIELGHEPADWLRHGVGVGTAATRCAAGRLASPGLIRTVCRGVLLSG